MYIFEIGPGSLEVPSQDMPCQDLFTGREAEEEEEAMEEPLLLAQQHEVEIHHDKRQRTETCVPRGRVGGKEGRGEDHTCNIYKYTPSDDSIVCTGPGAEFVPGAHDRYV